MFFSAILRERLLIFGCKELSKDVSYLEVFVLVRMFALIERLLLSLVLSQENNIFRGQTQAFVESTKGADEFFLI